MVYLKKAQSTVEYLVFFAAMVLAIFAGSRFMARETSNYNNKAGNLSDKGADVVAEHFGITKAAEVDDMELSVSFTSSDG